MLTSINLDIPTKVPTSEIVTVHLSLSFMEEDVISLCPPVRLLSSFLPSPFIEARAMDKRTSYPLLFTPKSPLYGRRIIVRQLQTRPIFTSN